ncbi:M15 family metallopeptidase [Clostridium sp.]|uniref:M15 family metallopeptidase n=1 Tax=Clostridium sp. TaxID=1506 RepID=UPI003217AE34
MEKSNVNRTKVSVNKSRNINKSKNTNVNRKEAINKRKRIKRRKRVMKRFMILIFLGIITGVYFMNHSKGESEGYFLIKDSNLILANKNYVLEDGYIPKDLVKVNVEFSEGVTEEETYMTKEAAKALEKLVEGASEENINLYGLSGYRSYSTQKNLYEYNVQTQGKEYSDKYVAKPGASEHQLGEAMDLAADWGWIYEGCAEATWIANNAYKYGFIVRYEQGKENITGYNYEPWHVRYVGKDTAKQVYNQGLTLEEYAGTY